MRLKKKHLACTAVILLTITGLYLCFRIEARSKESDGIVWEKLRRILPFEDVTRDPSRVITYNYLTSVNLTKPSKNIIDVSKAMFDWRELDNRMVIVTGFGRLQTYNGLGMIASVHAHMPLKKIIVYNLGIHTNIVEKMVQMCNVEVRHFNYTSYPKHVRKLDNKAWRVFALLELLDSYGSFFYADPRVRFRAPINLLFPFIADHNGIIVKKNDWSIPFPASLHPSHQSYFEGLNTKNITGEFHNVPAVSQDILLVVNSSELRKTFWHPLLKCASEAKCVASLKVSSPDSAVSLGEQARIQQFDFAVITLLLYQSYKTRWYTDRKLNEVLKRTYDCLEPNGVHDYLWAHYCSPSKEEVDCNVKSEC